MLSLCQLCLEELRLMALWTVVRWRSLCCSDGVSFAPVRVCQFLTRKGLWNLVKMTTLTRRDVLSVCVCVCVRARISHRKLLGGSINRFCPQPL